MRRRRIFLISSILLGASLLLAAQPLQARMPLQAEMPLQARMPLQAEMPAHTELYAFGIMGSTIGNAASATAPPGGYAASMGLGYALHWPTFFLALEGSSDFNTAQFVIDDADDADAVRQQVSRVCNSASCERAPGMPDLPIAQEMLVQFGMSLRVGARFRRADLSLFLGPHWARVETIFQPQRITCEERDTGFLGRGSASCQPQPAAQAVRSASIWSGVRFGATAAWPLSEQWALRTEYRYAQVSGRQRGWFHTLHQHDLMLGVQYIF